MAVLAAVCPAPAEQVVISRIMYHPRGEKPAYLEIFNHTSNPFDFAGWRLTGGVRFEFPESSPRNPVAGFLRPFERVVVSEAAPAAARAAYLIPPSVRVFGPWAGRLSHEGERLTLKDKNGVALCRVKYGHAERWPVGAAGTGRALVLIDPDRETDDGRNWTVTTRLDEAPGSAPVFNRTSPAPSPEIEATLGAVLIDYDTVWRYEGSGRDLGAGWREPAFDDRGWPQGPSLLGYDRKPLPKPGLRTQVTLGRQITYYFRTRFVYRGEASPGDVLLLDQIIDDGVVYYLNGREVGRTRLPAGPVTARTLASATVPDATEEIGEFTLDPQLLLKGENVLAAEVHQCKSTSSDIVFGLRLRQVPRPKPGPVINEVFADAGGGFIEFCNTALAPVNLKGCFISDTEENLRRHLFTNDLVLAPGGLAAVSLAECGLGNARPLTVYLTAAGGLEVLNAVTVNFAEDGRPVGRKPDGAAAWFRFPEPTRGAPNPARDLAGPTRRREAQAGSNAVEGIEVAGPQAARSASPLPPQPAGIVINEIMYDPPYGAAGTEFIELYNRGAGPVDLAGWQLSEGITFDFPRGATLPAGCYLVVAADRARLESVYGGIPLLGNYRGHLRHGGESVRLVDALSNVVDEVEFKAGGDWPELAHGGGSSLELIHPWLDNSRSSAWRDSDEAGKSAWQTCACTNTYLEMNPFGQPTDYREVHLHLVGHGHVALRKIGLWRQGINYLDHPERLSTDGSSASGWLAQGTHAATFLTNGELHIVSDGHGDNRADRVEIDCVRIRRGERYELRFEARWIAGCPRLVAQTWDHSIGTSFLLALPARLGTPGRPNSVAPPPPFEPAQAAPQVDDLAHSPAVPRSTDPVRISARVASPAPLAAVRLFHRRDSADGASAWAVAPMFDDGVQGSDAVAGDGLYTADLTEYKTNETVVQFYVEAAAANGRNGTQPRAGAARPAMFVVDNRRLRHDLRLDRFIVSAFDLGALGNGNTPQYRFRYPRLSNHRFNMTFISNEEKIFYGGAIRVSGSPFTRGSDLGKGKWELPEDRPFRGRTKFYFDNDSNYHNQLCRYLLYQLGHVAGESEWIHVVVNSSSPYLKQDTEPVTGEFLQRRFKDGSHGDLYRIDDEWWFADDWEHVNRDADWQYKGLDDPSRYRTEWQKRTREVEDDYTALIGLFKTYSANRYTQAEIERVLDAEAILQYAAVRGYINDWDNFTMFRGKNGYFYRRSEDGRFQFLQWDSDLAFRDVNYPFYGPRLGAWLERPYNWKRFQGCLAKLIEFSTSPRLAAWFALQTAANTARPPATEFYQAFFEKRNQMAATLAAPEQPAPSMPRNIILPARPAPPVLE
jgi:hypothetical protein